MKGKPMKHLIYSFLAIATGLFSVSIGHAENFYFVQSETAQIMSQPSFKSEIVTQVGFGEKLSATGKVGNWVKVMVGSKAGYISTLLVSNHAPMKKVGIVKADGAEIDQGVRRRASSYSSAAAARGLTKDDRKRADEEGKADYAAVKKMESVTITDDEVTRFSAGEKK